MWAVVEIGKKQYKVKRGDTITVERLKVEGNIVLDKVLLLYEDEKLFVGAPYLPEAKVEAACLDEKKLKKITVYKYHAKKKYRVKNGHRQIATILKISNIIKPK